MPSGKIVSRVGHRGRGKWLNRLAEHDKKLICEAYRNLKSVNKVERHIQRDGEGPSHSVITRILKEANVPMNPVGWPSMYRRMDASLND